MRELKIANQIIGYIIMFTGCVGIVLSLLK